MVEALATLSNTVRGQMHRRKLERQLLDLVARLPEHPESRSAYQRLVEEHTKLAAGAESSGQRQHHFHQRATERPT